MNGSLHFWSSSASKILICIPLLLPVVQSMGYNPIQFGVTLVLALMIGLLTPPMAICLFITSKIGGISFMRAFKAVKVDLEHMISDIIPLEQIEEGFRMMLSKKNVGKILVQISK